MTISSLVQLADAEAVSQYWTAHLHSVMVPLLKAAGTYTPEEQAKHLAFLEKVVSHNLGPLPTEPHAPYTAPSAIVGSPFDPSINFTSSGNAKVRFDHDLLAPLNRAGSDPFGEAQARELVRDLASKIEGSDTRWFEYLMDSFWLQGDEVDAALKIIPPHVTTCPGAVGFDLDGGKITLKAYVPVVCKAFATGKSFSDVIINALRKTEHLGVDLQPSLDFVAEYMATTNDDRKLMLVGVDCVEPQDARVKMYCHVSNNSWNVVKDIMTLGGRLTDETSITRVDMLKTIWPLLLDEPDMPIEDESWSKEQKIKRTGFSGLQFTIELTPGEAIPDLKVYVPLFQYARSHAQSEKNIEAILKKLNHSWGTSGKYAETMRTVFGEEKKYGQTYASFSYSKSKGAYMTSYVAKPIDFGAAGLDGVNHCDFF
ncbi:aromatic prenyltransferase [Xylariaceae sp. FL0016]|nr:aromatic prenyltransferase [Xylariaceae sp. FL0016]